MVIRWMVVLVVLVTAGETPVKTEGTIVRASFFTSRSGCVMLNIVLWLRGPTQTLIGTFISHVV